MCSAFHGSKRLWAAARSQARPGAADAVAEILLALAERRPLPSDDDVARLAVRVPGAAA